jgi:SAM-dependent methyltransferase
MLNWALRYAPIVRFIRQRRPASVLEVGSGAHGVAHYLPDWPIVGTDIAFAGPRSANLLAVRARAERLPFPDRSFELVLSSDMLEHLAVPDREPALREMLRIATRHVIVGFPSGPHAEQVDRRIARRLEADGIALPGWLTEHFQFPYPEARQFLPLVDRSGCRARVLRNSNSWLHEAVIVREFGRRWARLLASLDSVALVNAFSALLARGPTYREILVIDKA